MGYKVKYMRTLLNHETVIQLNSVENVMVQKLYIMSVCSYYVKCIVIHCSFCLLLKQPHFVLLHQWPQTLCH